MRTFSAKGSPTCTDGSFLCGLAPVRRGCNVEGFGGQHGDAADTVEAGGGSEEDNLVALAGGEGQV